MPPPPNRRRTSFSPNVSAENTDEHMEQEKSYEPTIIIDLGSFETRCGFNNQEEPSVVLPTVVAIQRGLPEGTKPDIVAGKDALKLFKKRKNQVKNDHNANPSDQLYSLRYPVQKGVIMDWDQVEAIWRKCFSELNAAENEHKVMVMCDAHNTPDFHLESIAELMFEIFKVPRLHIAMPAVMSLFSLQKETGVIVDCGSGTTSIIAVVDGVAHYKSMCRFPIAGQDISRHLVKLLANSGYTFSSTDEYRVVNHIKENMAYVALDLDHELAELKKNPKDFEQELELPGGESVILRSECFLCPELLFEPSLAGVQGVNGLQREIWDVAQHASQGKQSTMENLLKNVILTGGVMQIHGMADRVERELKEIIKKLRSPVKRVKVRVLGSDAAWKGAQVWTSAAAEGDAEVDWIRIDEYERKGPGIMQKRVFK